MRSNDVEYVNAIQSNEGWLKILESFARFVNPRAGQMVLDIGSGPGALANLFSTHYETRSVGMDFNPVMLGQSIKLYPAVQFVAGDAYWLPFQGKTFDLVTATNVLYLLDDPMPVWREIARVLKPDGALVMLNPSPEMSLQSATALADARELTGAGRDQLLEWGSAAEKHHRWSTADLQSLIGSVGLSITETQARIGDGLALYVRAIVQ